MSLMPHLFGSPTLTGAVGKGATNSPSDVKTIKALFNAYRRSNDQAALPVDGTGGEALVAFIEAFQNEELKAPKPDGRIDPGGKTLAGLLRCLRGSYTVQAMIAPAKGKLTWEVEGHEGGPFHSRRLHVPNADSGLTLGRGYDLKARMSANVQDDLAGAGVPGNIAFTISTAAKLSGVLASRFVIDNDLLDYEITPHVQLKLFEKVYEEHLADVKRVSNGTAMVTAYGKVDWGKLDQRIADVLADLRYRGDYNKKTIPLIQKHVANNDFVKFKAEIIKKSNWPGVPDDRFERRKAYVETAKSQG